MKRKRKNNGFFAALFSDGQTARVQMFFMIITTITISIFFYMRLTEDAVISDPMPHINFYMPEKRGSLRMRIAQVNTGLAIKNFSVFDTLNNKFILDANIWFEYDPIMVTLDTVSKFSFQKGTFIKKSPPDVKVVGNKVLARFEVTVEFTSDLDQRFFPFDDHRIDLVLTNEFVTHEEMIYVSRDANFNIAPNIFVAGYQYLDKRVEYGYVESQTYDAKRSVANPVVLFSIEFGKAGARKPIMIILPLVLMFFIAVFALTINPMEEKILVLELVIAALPAILAYRFVIENMAPKVGYSTLTDHIFSFILGIAFIAFLIASYYASRGTTPFNERSARRAFIISSYVALVSVIYYLFFYWGRS